MRKRGEIWEKLERVELKTAEFAREARNRVPDPTLRYRRTTSGLQMSGWGRRVSWSLRISGFKRAPEVVPRPSFASLRSLPEKIAALTVSDPPCASFLSARTWFNVSPRNRRVRYKGNCASSSARAIIFIARTRRVPFQQSCCKSALNSTTISSGLWAFQDQFFLEKYYNVTPTTKRNIFKKRNILSSTKNGVIFWTTFVETSRLIDHFYC